MSNKNSSSRRHFISNSVKAGLAIGIGMHSSSSFATPSTEKNIWSGPLVTGFDQQPLPYKYNELENNIDAMTMEIHYTKHAAGYSKNLKDAALAEGVDMTKPLEDVLAKISKYSSKMRNNAGGHYNHEMFWQSMRPQRTSYSLSRNLSFAIEKNFGSLDAFKKQFADAGKNRFGSGWAWLYADKDKNLKIGSTPNQDNPLMDISEIKGIPLLGLDVWEHAYYLKYQNKRADYIDNWWNVVNWDFVGLRFESV